MNLKQQDTQHPFYKVVSNLVRREFKNVFFFLFNFKLVWFKLLQIRGTKLSNGLLAKKKNQISYCFLLVFFFLTDEEIYIDCLFYLWKVLHEKWMVGMNLLST